MLEDLKSQFPGPGDVEKTHRKERRQRNSRSTLTLTYKQGGSGLEGGVETNYKGKE